MERVLDQMEEIQALQSRVAELEDEVEALKDVYEE
jgi:hypothetical protein